jgi:beta-glucanase (GH16 family)
MRRAFAVLLAVVGVSLAFTQLRSASAGPTELTIEEPTLATPGSARLSGTATGTTQVRIDYSLNGTWMIAISAVPVVKGRWEAVVPALETPVRYRAVYRTTSSPTVEVTGAPAQEPDPVPVPDPVPEDEPEAPPEPPSAGTSDACGQQPLKADGTPWTCTLADDFDGTELDRSVWMPQTVFRSGEDEAWACYLDDPSVVSVADGNLDLTVRKLPASEPCAGQNDGSTPYVAGMVSTYRLFSQQYGRFEARIKNTAATVPGLQETFWLWPDDRYSTDEVWPAAGEIDISETYSQYPDLAIPFLHYTAYDNGGPVPGMNTSWSCAAQRGVYNTYTLEWTSDRIEIFVNGTSCLVNTADDPAFDKPYIVTLTQLLGVAGNTLTDATPLPATMSIDYFRAWK